MAVTQMVVGFFLGFRGYSEVSYIMLNVGKHNMLENIMCYLDDVKPIVCTF